MTSFHLHSVGRDELRHFNDKLAPLPLANLTAITCKLYHALFNYERLRYVDVNVNCNTAK